MISRHMSKSSPRPSTNACGFTIMEILIVVVILGIVAAFAVPGYRRSMEQSYFRSSQEILLTVYGGQRSYFFMNGNYLRPPGVGNWSDIQMDDPNDDLTTFLPVTFTWDAVACPGAAPICFIAEASRTTGGCSTKVLTIDETRTFGGTWSTACM